MDGSPIQCNSLVRYKIELHNNHYTYNIMFMYMYPGAMELLRGQIVLDI